MVRATRVTSGPDRERMEICSGTKIKMPSTASIFVTAIAAVVVSLLAGCATYAAPVQSGDANAQAPDSRSGKSPQLPKSYPCQNLHVKTPNCPPR